jgi:lysyl-tRNA synthetase class 2
MTIPLLTNEMGYLHTSPEYAMKRLLSEGSGDIYQLGHVFRDGEVGRLHNPEFTMIEWYRLGFTFEQMIDETLDLIRLFLKGKPATHITYREALQKYAGIDYLTAPIQDLINLVKPHAPGASTWDRDTLLQFIMGDLIEPKFQDLTVLKYYPASQSALSKTTTINNEPVALRFEIYAQGIELANGYHELTDPVEQRRRLLSQNNHRARLGKSPLPIDELFLKALEKGLPDCCGVAVGFDRLLMLRHKKTHLSDVIPFAWQT